MLDSKPGSVERGCKNLGFKVFFKQKKPNNLKSPNFWFLGFF